MKDQILAIIRNIASDNTISENDHLVFERILSSLEIIELISELENNFGIKISFEEILPDNFDTVDAIAKMVERLKK